jgi:hypothetical protein
MPVTEKPYGRMAHFSPRNSPLADLDVPNCAVHRCFDNFNRILKASGFANFRGTVTDEADIHIVNVELAARFTDFEQLPLLPVGVDHDFLAHSSC